MTDTSSGTQALDRALALFEAILRDDGASTVGILAAASGLPESSAHRFITAFRRRGWLARTGHGRYAAGPMLGSIAPHIDERTILARAARPVLRRLARDLGATVHLGIFEDDMVTYLVKEAGNRLPLFTREGMQLEAYCSGIGKVLLAHCPDEQREAYLAGGPFIKLTANTIIDPDQIRADLNEVRTRGFATDQAEISDDLYCVAIPVRDASGTVIAAVSASCIGRPAADENAMIAARMQGCVATMKP